MFICQTLQILFFWMSIILVQQIHKQQKNSKILTAVKSQKCCLGKQTYMKITVRFIKHLRNKKSFEKKNNRNVFKK